MKPISQVDSLPPVLGRRARGIDYTRPGRGRGRSWVDAQRYQAATRPRWYAGKRYLDVALAALLLVLCFPLMVLIAIVVRLDSRGSALYRQERIGRNGKPFVLTKFRSMYVDAEAASGPVWAREGDPRVTRAGRVLRRCRLDELPQLVNVLAGEMSLVGPRPERRVFVEELSRRFPRYAERQCVEPGLTGWAQINQPYCNTIDDARKKLQYDLYYIENRSLLLDLSILVHTIKIVVSARGT